MTGEQTPPDGVIRTASGRDTYHPDGHVHGPHAFFSSHSYSKSQEQSALQESSSHGSGLFPASAQTLEAGSSYLVEEEVRLSRAASSASSSSSNTRYGSNGQPKKKRLSSSDTEANEMGGRPLARRATKSEIDPEGRRELQRIMTGASQRITQQMSIAQPGDPTIDPGSESFDLTRFLKTFRHNLANEGVEMKKVSVVYRNLNVFGSGKALQLQKTVADLFLAPLRFREYFGKSERKQILHQFDGIIRVSKRRALLQIPIG